MSKMNEKDLAYLKEVTGLETSKVQVNTTRKNNKELEKYVGKFVCVGNTYGMIDEVCGNRLGYVHSENGTWTGELVNLNDVRTELTDVELWIARESARNYMENEIKSANFRMKKPNADKATFKILKHIDNVRTLLNNKC